MVLPLFDKSSLPYKRKKKSKKKKKEYKIIITFKIYPKISCSCQSGKGSRPGFQKGNEDQEQKQNLIQYKFIKRKSTF